MGSTISTGISQRRSDPENPVRSEVGQETRDSKEERQLRDELKRLLGPLVPVLLRDAKGDLDLSRIPAKDFDEFKQFLSAHAALNDNKSFRTPYKKMLEGEEFGSLLRFLYQEKDPSQFVSISLEEGRRQLDELTAALIEVDADAFVQRQLNTREGLGRLRHVLGRVESFTGDQRADVAKALARARGDSEDRLYSHCIDQEISLWNFFNLGVQEEEVSRVSGLAVKLIEGLEDRLPNPNAAFAPLHGVEPSLVEKYQKLQKEKASDPNPVSQAQAALADLWLLTANPKLWSIQNPYGGLEDRTHALKGIEALLTESESIQDESGFRAFNEKLLDFLEGAVTTEGDDAGSWLNYRVLGIGMDQVYDNVDSVQRGPYQKITRLSSEWKYAAESGHTILSHLQSNSSEDKAVQDGANRLILNLKETQRQLWYGYKQHKAVSRLGSELIQIPYMIAKGVGAEASADYALGDLAQIDVADQEIGRIIAQLEKAKSPEELAQELDKLHALLKPGSALYTAYETAEMDGTEQILGLAQTVAIITATAAATRGGSVVAGTGVVAARTIATASWIDKVIKGFAWGAYIATAENAIAAGTGEVREGGETADKWVKDAIATGTATAMTGPWTEAAAGTVPEQGVVRNLFLRYTSNGLQGVKHLGGDIAMETGEEVADQVLRQGLDGKTLAPSLAQLEEITKLTVAGGGTKIGALAQAMKQGSPLAHTVVSQAETKSPTSPLALQSPLLAPMWTMLGAGGIGGGPGGKDDPKKIKKLDSSEGVPSSQLLQAALLAIQNIPQAPPELHASYFEMIKEYGAKLEIQDRVILLESIGNSPIKLTPNAQQMGKIFIELYATLPKEIQNEIKNSELDGPKRIVDNGKVETIIRKFLELPPDTASSQRLKALQELLATIELAPTEKLETYFEIIKKFGSELEIHDRLTLLDDLDEAFLEHDLDEIQDLTLDAFAELTGTLPPLVLKEYYDILESIVMHYQCTIAAASRGLLSLFPRLDPADRLESAKRLHGIWAFKFIEESDWVPLQAALKLHLSPEQLEELDRDPLINFYRNPKKSTEAKKEGFPSVSEIENLIGKSAHEKLTLLETHLDNPDSTERSKALEAMANIIIGLPPKERLGKSQVLEAEVVKRGFQDFSSIGALFKVFPHLEPEDRLNQALRLEQARSTLQEETNWGWILVDAMRGQLSPEQDVVLAEEISRSIESPPEQPRPDKKKALSPEQAGEGDPPISELEDSPEGIPSVSEIEKLTDKSIEERLTLLKAHFDNPDDAERAEAIEAYAKLWMSLPLEQRTEKKSALVLLSEGLAALGVKREKEPDSAEGNPKELIDQWFESVTTLPPERRLKEVSRLHYIAVKANAKIRELIYELIERIGLSLEIPDRIELLERMKYFYDQEPDDDAVNGTAAEAFAHLAVTLPPEQISDLYEGLEEIVRIDLGKYPGQVRALLHLFAHLAPEDQLSSFRRAENSFRWKDDSSILSAMREILSAEQLQELEEDGAFPELSELEDADDLSVEERLKRLTLLEVYLDHPDSSERADALRIMVDLILKLPASEIFAKFEMLVAEVSIKEFEDLPSITALMEVFPHLDPEQRLEQFLRLQENHAIFPGKNYGETLFESLSGHLSPEQQITIALKFARSLSIEGKLGLVARQLRTCKMIETLMDFVLPVSSEIGPEALRKYAALKNQPDLVRIALYLESKLPLDWKHFESFWKATDPEKVIDKSKINAVGIPALAALALDPSLNDSTWSGNAIASALMLGLSTLLIGMSLRSEENKPNPRGPYREAPPLPPNMKELERTMFNGATPLGDRLAAIEDFHEKLRASPHSRVFHGICILLELAADPNVSLFRQTIQHATTSHTDRRSIRLAAMKAVADLSGIAGANFWEGQPHSIYSTGQSRAMMARWASSLHHFLTAARADLEIDILEKYGKNASAITAITDLNKPLREAFLTTLRNLGLQENSEFLELKDAKYWEPSLVRWSKFLMPSTVALAGGGAYLHSVAMILSSSLPIVLFGAAWVAASIRKYRLGRQLPEEENPALKLIKDLNARRLPEAKSPEVRIQEFGVIESEVSADTESKTEAEAEAETELEESEEGSDSKKNQNILSLALATGGAGLATLLSPDIAEAAVSLPLPSDSSALSIASGLALAAGLGMLGSVYLRLRHMLGYKSGGLRLETAIRARAEAIQADPRLIELHRNLHMPDSRLRILAVEQAAKNEFRELMADLISLLHDPEPRVRVAAQAALTQMATEEEISSAQKQREAEIEELRGYFHDPASGMRELAASRAWIYRDRSFIPELLGMVDDSNPKIGNGVFGSLALLANASDLPSLILILKSKPGPELENRLKILVNYIVRHSPVSDLEEHFRDFDPFVRGRMIAATMTRSDLEGLPLLVKSLQDPDPQVRIAAIEALQLVGTAEALPEIKKRLADPSPSVRFVANIAVDVLSREDNDRPTQPPKPRGPWDLH